MGFSFSKSTSGLTFSAVSGVVTTTDTFNIQGWLTTGRHYGKSVRPVSD